MFVALFCVLFFTQSVSAVVFPLDPNDPAVLHLLDLCRADVSDCAQAFYLWTVPPASSDALERATFALLLGKLLDGGTLATMPDWNNYASLVAAATADPSGVGADLAAYQDAWWLDKMRNAVFCGGLSNRVFRLGKGCICAPDSDCSEQQASNINAYEYVTFSVLAAFNIVIVGVGVFVILQDNLATRRAMREPENLARTLAVNPQLALKFGVLQSVSGSLLQPEMMTMAQWEQMRKQK